MGNAIKKAKDLADWAFDVIKAAANYVVKRVLEPFEEFIEGKAFARLLLNQVKIDAADNPKKVAEFVTIDEEITQSNAKLDERRQQLSKKDQEIARSCLVVTSGVDIFASKSWGG